MELTLDRNDLRDECREINASMTRFKHFKPSAQKAIIAAGHGYFRENVGTQNETYNRIYRDQKA